MRACVIALAMAAAVISIAATAAGVEETDMSETSAIHCVGRFAVTVAGATVVGRDSRFDYVEIEEGPPGDPPAAAWERRRAEIARMPPPLGREATLIRRIDLTPEREAVYYRGDPVMPDSITLETQRAAGERWARFRIKGVPGKEPVMEDVLRDVSGAWRAGADSAGFCTGGGVVVLAFHAMEAATLGLSLPAVGGRLSISTESVGTPAPPAEQSLADDIARAATSGVAVEMLRDGERTVAGLAGRELAFRVSGDGRAGLRFEWRFDGVPGRGDRPRIRILLVDDGARDAPSPELGDAWEAVLAAFRPRAPG